jgi:hypothetical protein
MRRLPEKAASFFMYRKILYEADIRLLKLYKIHGNLIV